MSDQQLPTLLYVLAFTERGTFTRRASGRWTEEEREEELATLRADFYRSLSASGIRRIQLRTSALIKSPLFGWAEVEA